MVGNKGAGSCEAVRESHSSAVLSRLGVLGSQLEVAISQINVVVTDVTKCAERPLAEETDTKALPPLPPLFNALRDRIDFIEMQVARLTDLLERLEL